jgi:biopolymer transport protein ExbD
MKRSHKKHEIPDTRSIDMTPMIDVVFQLILFFMLTSSMSQPNQIELDLPSSSSGAKADLRQLMVVTYRHVDGKGEMKLNGKMVNSLDDLGTMMKASGNAAATARVDVRIDKNVPYQEVIAVMDVLRGAGYPKFALLTLAPQGAGGAGAVGGGKAP